MFSPLRDQRGPDLSVVTGILLDGAHWEVNESRSGLSWWEVPPFFFFFSMKQKRGKEADWSWSILHQSESQWGYFSSSPLVFTSFNCRRYGSLGSASLEHWKQATVCNFKQGLGFFSLLKVIWFIPNKRRADFFSFCLQAIFLAVIKPRSHR